MATTTKQAETLDGLRRRVEALERVCAEAYQFAGVVGAPVRVLDTLAAAADGLPLPHDSMLPITADECDVTHTLTALDATLARAIEENQRMLGLLRRLRGETPPVSEGGWTTFPGPDE